MITSTSFGRSKIEVPFNVTAPTEVWLSTIELPFDSTRVESALLNGGKAFELSFGWSVDGVFNGSACVVLELRSLLWTTCLSAIRQSISCNSKLRRCLADYLFGLHESLFRFASEDLRDRRREERRPPIADLIVGDVEDGDANFKRRARLCGGIKGFIRRTAHW